MSLDIQITFAKKWWQRAMKELFVLTCLVAASHQLNFGHKPWPKNLPRPSHVVSRLGTVQVPASWTWANVDGVNYLTQV